MRHSAGIAAVVALFVALGCGAGQSTARTPVAEDPGGMARSDDGTARAGSPAPGATQQPGGAQPGGMAMGTPASAPNPEAPPAGANEPTPPPKVEANEVTLRFAFNANDKYRFTSSTETNSESKSNDGSPRKSKFTTSQKLDVQVVSVKDGKAQLETKVSDFKVDGDANDQQAQMIKAMMAQSGELVTKAVYNTLGIPQGDNPDLTDMARSMVNGSGAAIGVMGINYPDRAIKVGDSWTAEFDMGKILSGRMPPQMQVSVEGGKVPTKYTLRAIDAAKGVATIEIAMSGSPKMRLAMPPQKDSEGNEVKVPPMEISLGVTSKGTAKIDLKTGMPVEIVTESTSSTAGTGVMDGKQATKTTVRRA